MPNLFLVAKHTTRPVNGILLIKLMRMVADTDLATCKAILDRLQPDQPQTLPVVHAEHLPELCAQLDAENIDYALDTHSLPKNDTKSELYFDHDDYFDPLQNDIF